MRYKNPYSTNPFATSNTGDVKFTAEHNFRRITQYNATIPSLAAPTDPRMGKWWCQNCDSVVMYPKYLSDSDINRMIMQAGKFKCLEPIPSAIA